MEGLFSRSLQEKEILDVIYVDSRGEMSQRSIHVMDIRESTLLVYCYVRGKVRTLKKDNILSVYPYKRGRNRKAAEV
ncbi:MAG: hypothetical protein WAM07_05370 [Halobacillus sp.]|uniref:hypothetical protein n=1 Tax=Halobacillus sp. TaxID=56800 RepID=UPI003BAFBE3F